MNVWPNPELDPTALRAAGQFNVMHIELLDGAMSLGAGGVAPGAERQLSLRTATQAVHVV
jgi:hypothetical protein